MRNRRNLTDQAGVPITTQPVASLPETKDWRGRDKPSSQRPLPLWGKEGAQVAAAITYRIMQVSSVFQHVELFTYRVSGRLALGCRAAGFNPRSTKEGKRVTFLCLLNGGAGWKHIIFWLLKDPEVLSLEFCNREAIFQSLLISPITDALEVGSKFHTHTLTTWLPIQCLETLYTRIYMCPYTHSPAPTYKRLLLCLCTQLSLIGYSEHYIFHLSNEFQCKARPWGEVTHTRTKCLLLLSLCAVAGLQVLI